MTTNQRMWTVLLTSTMLCALVACTGPTASTPPTATGPATSTPRDQVIVLGDISDDPGEVIEGTQPLADYLAAQLGDFGISQSQVRIATNADEMIQLLKSGQVDLYFDSVYPITLICDESGAQPILRRWRYGVEEYYTVIFASAESGINSVDDLSGHIIAMDNPFSTSGFALPAVFLSKRGLQLAVKSSYEDPVPDSQVGIVFSYDDANTLQWVMNGLVAAGATDDYSYGVAFPSDAREKLVVLSKTESVPRQVAAVRPGLDPQLLEAIKRILISAHENEQGQAALEPFQTTRFDEFPEGIEAAQNRMRDMMEIIQAIPMPNNNP